MAGILLIGANTQSLQLVLMQINNYDSYRLFKVWLFYSFDDFLFYLLCCLYCPNGLLKAGSFCSLLERDFFNCLGFYYQQDLLCAHQFIVIFDSRSIQWHRSQVGCWKAEVDTDYDYLCSLRKWLPTWYSARKCIYNQLESRLLFLDIVVVAFNPRTSLSPPFPPPPHPLAKKNSLVE